MDFELKASEEAIEEIKEAVGYAIAKNEDTAFENLLDVYNACSVTIADLWNVGCDARGRRPCVCGFRNPNFTYYKRLDRSILEKIAQDINVSELRREEATAT